MKKLFISYSYEDVVFVKKFTLLLSLYGFDVWMDEKNISNGEYYTSKILKGIHESDAYLVFLSKNSVNSKWVDAEIDFALKEKIEKNRLTVVPVLMEDFEIPVPLSNLDCLDARFSMQEAVADFANQCKASLGKRPENANGILVSSVSFAISEKTSVEVGPFQEAMTMSDLEEDRNRILQELRKKSYGILMNFVSVDQFDFQSETPKFSNGLYAENVTREAGSTSGSIRERVVVETDVFRPDMNKVNRLLNERLDVLSISSVCFGFSVPTKEGENMLDVGKRCMQKLQDKYMILSYDPNEGAKIELSEDFYLFFAISEDVIRIKLSTKYNWQFEKKYRDFSVFEFIHEILAQ